MKDEWVWACMLLTCEFVKCVDITSLLQELLRSGSMHVLVLMLELTSYPTPLHVPD